MSEESHKAPTLEAALLFLADKCDGANSKDGQGFNEYDAIFGKAMAEKVLKVQRLSEQEYKDVYVMLKKYNGQLSKGGMDIRLISKDPPNLKKGIEKVQPPQEAIVEAQNILEYGDPIQAHVEYATKVRKVHGGEKTARVITMSTYSCYLPVDDRLHLDVAGSSQIGKSRTVTTILETFPEENVLVLTEASPKSIYYFAETNPERLKDLTIYLDDAREEHIPVLKTFRNEGNVTPSNLTVGDDKESALQQVQYRPVIIDSSVNPIHDFERQAPSRAFLVSIPDTTPEEEKEVHKAIRLVKRTEAIVSLPTGAAPLKTLSR